ncbi:Pectinesterase [Phytophthora nicotianae]|uniref:Pectinesterase n=1 Tax=Phytophthora nicotianae TaxID=4792 RepID=A0A0W8D534_PHYNI|nr:Pectinesterase [Phytophthora nicotianae]
MDSRLAQEEATSSPSYAENRRIEDPQLREDVAVLSKAGAKPRGILSYLRAKTGKLMLLKDVHNLIHGVKKTFRGGRTDAERAIAVLDEFIESATGNTAECIVDSETNVIRVVTFQSARQKRLFAAFPEVVLVDSTHGTNVNRYKLFSFAVHDVFGLLATCDCIFSQTCLLPCRHVMYDRSKANFETVIPPLHTFSSRWIVQSPSNNIDDGAVVPGGLNRVSCPPIRVLPPVDRDTKYCRSKQITDKINDVMSIQPSTTYRLAMPWVEGFHTARHAGKLEEFQGRGLIPSSAGFPSLSQISVSDSVTISLLSFAERSADALLEDKGPSSVVHDTIRVKKTAEATRDLPTASLKALSAEDGKGSASSAVQGSAAAPIAFGSPPKRKGLSKRALKNKNLGRR